MRPLNLYITSSNRSKRDTETKSSASSLASSGDTTFVRQLQSNLRTLQTQCPLLRKHSSSSSGAAVLNRDRIQIETSAAAAASGSSVVSDGQFYESFQITGICLNRGQKCSPTVLEEASSGSYSIKQLAKHAIKTHSVRGPSVLQAATNLLLEARYLSMLNHRNDGHPNIISIKAQGDPSLLLQQGQLEGYFIVTERIQQTLQERLELYKRWEMEKLENSVNQAQECQLFQTRLGHVKDIASALQYLHERNLVMLGLSPTSVGFLPDGHLVLCDLSTCREVPTPSPTDLKKKTEAELEEERRLFGTSALDSDHENETKRILNDLMMPPVEVGTVPRYIAPELLTHSSPISTNADSYSWAMVALEILTLHKPFGNYKSGQHLLKVCYEGKRPNLSTYKLPQQVESALRKAWRGTVKNRACMNRVLQMLDELDIPDADKNDENEASTSSSSSDGGDLAEPQRPVQVVVQEPSHMNCAEDGDQRPSLPLRSGSNSNRICDLQSEHRALMARKECLLSQLAAASDAEPEREISLLAQLAAAAANVERPKSRSPRRNKPRRSERKFDESSAIEIKKTLTRMPSSFAEDLNNDVDSSTHSDPCCETNASTKSKCTRRKPRRFASDSPTHKSTLSTHFARATKAVSKQISSVTSPEARKEQIMQIRKDVRVKKEARGR